MAYTRHEDDGLGHAVDTPLCETEVLASFWHGTNFSLESHMAGHNLLLSQTQISHTKIENKIDRRKIGYKISSG